MKITKRFPIAWVAILGAMIGVTSFVPLVPYITGGGFIPLSISLAALAPLLLGFQAGILAALVGGIIGMFLNPASYPFGPVDVFFVAMAPAVFCGLAFKGDKRGYRIVYLAIIILSGILAELVPYYYPGATSGFGKPPQPLYLLLVAFFFIPWAIIYASPLGTRYIQKLTETPKAKNMFVGMLIGTLTGLMPWSLWMIAPAALTLNFSPELAVATWFFAAYSRAILSVIAAIIAVPLVLALARSGMPVPPGAIWKPRR